MKKNKNMYALCALLVVTLSAANISYAAQEEVPRAPRLNLRDLRQALKTEQQFLAFAQREDFDKRYSCLLGLLAIEGGFLDGLKYLIEKNLVNGLFKDQFGNMILHGASCHPHLPIITYIANTYPDMLSARNNLGETPFLMAVRMGNLQAMTFLITTGRIDIFCINAKAQQAIHLASELGHLHIVKHFVEICGVSPNTKSSTNVTPLQWAAGFGQLPVVEYLVSKGADIQSADQAGRTALMGAVISGSLPVASFLVKNGAQLGRRDAQGATVLHLAAAAGKLEIVKLLVKQCKFPVDVTDVDFRAPLAYAAQNGQVAVMEYLIENGAKIDGVRYVQQSPLLSALSQRQTDAAVFLVRQGANLYSEHFKVAKSTGQLGEILSGAIDVLASGQIDDRPFWVYVNAKALNCCTQDKNHTAQKLNAWMDSEDGKACALLTQIVPFFRKLNNRGRNEVRKLQETERLLRQHVPRDVAQLILCDFLPIPRQLLSQVQREESFDADESDEKEDEDLQSLILNAGAESYEESETLGGDSSQDAGVHKRDRDNDDREDDHAAGNDNDGSGVARAAKRQRRR